MKKFIFIFMILTLFLSSTSYATDVNQIINSQKQSLNIEAFINESQKFTQNSLEGVEINELLSSAISGNVNNEKLWNSIYKIFLKEISDCISIIASIVVIIIIHSILKSISDGLENKSISQIVYYVQYILIVTLVMVNFSEIINMVRESINNLITFINLLLPILVTLMISTGCITSASILQPIIIFLITIIGNLINNVLIPIVLVGTALGIISQVSERVQIDKLSKYLKSSTIWILGVSLTIFVGVVSLEGTLSSSVDGITAKTTKAAVSSVIPVVGKILGDAVDSVIGCGVILKNALGVIGVIVIIGICIAPIIKLTILTLLYYLISAICQPIADSKIIKLLEHMGDTFKLFLAILCSVSAMLIIGVTLIVRITNNGNMYS